MATMKIMKREFFFKEKDLTLDDPNPELSPDEILEIYANTYPELTNAVCIGPEVEKDVAKFTFKSNVGTKG